MIDSLPVIINNSEKDLFIDRIEEEGKEK